MPPVLVMMTQNVIVLGRTGRLEQCPGNCLAIHRKQPADVDDSPHATCVTAAREGISVAAQEWSLAGRGGCMQSPAKPPSLLKATDAGSDQKPTAEIDTSNCE